MTTKRTAKKTAKKAAKKITKRAAAKTAKKATRTTRKVATAPIDPDEELDEELNDSVDEASVEDADPDEATAVRAADEDDSDATAEDEPSTASEHPLEEGPVEVELEPVELLPDRRVPATRDELLEDFGGEYLSIQSLFEFCFVPTGRLAFLRDLAVQEDWGDNGTVLLKYLAVNVRLAIEQEAYVWNGDQLVMTVGGLTTPAGTPIYLGLVRNQDPGQNPWVMNWVGERPSCAELPRPARLPQWPSAIGSGEIVVAAELSDPERRVRIPALEGITPVAQSCAIVGAVHWALRRGLAVKQLHGPSRGYFVPLFLRQREDATDVPDGAAPVMTVGTRLVVRAVLEPHICYPSARALVERWDQLPTWLIESWDASRENAAD
ncbi:hypothetical protein Pla163_16070 [Planctomycetes bacterium Pla163]|uniref:DUF3825 domain-containing protein n=1 Tax=Rohdeia mirabilis TaxID=2528008 RepID=A0A518CZ54_9BACT|nr:hypothetical protein Pla163_16070 [Planctomycetes bacterium Pla163]